MVAELEHPLSREDPRDKKAYFTKMTGFRRVATPLAITLFSMFADLTVHGAENIIADGPVIVAANHLTNMDVLPLQMAVQSRPIFYMGKEELFRNPLMDWGLRHMGGFPVYRGASDEWAMRHAEMVLRRGLVLGIFPEGSRSRGKGLTSAKSGAARLAMAVGCPILPVAVHGPQYMFKQLKRRTPVQVSLGQPIYARPGESALGLTDRMMFAMAEMLPHEQRGVYATHPKGF